MRTRSPRHVVWWCYPRTRSCAARRELGRNRGHFPRRGEAPANCIFPTFGHGRWQVVTAGSGQLLKAGLSVTLLERGVPWWVSFGVLVNLGVCIFSIPCALSAFLYTLCSHVTPCTRRRKFYTEWAPCWRRHHLPSLLDRSPEGSERGVGGMRR